MDPEDTGLDVSSFLKEFFAGGIAASISETIVAPLERVKILLQVQFTSRQMTREQHYKGIVDAFVRVTKDQGFTSLWRGNFTHIIRCFPTYSLNFAFKETYQKIYFRGVDPKANLGYHFVGNLICGGLAGATTLTIVYPLDFVETRLAADVGHVLEHRQFTGIVSVISQIVKSDGFGGLYRGFGSSVQGIIVYRSAFFGLFDTAKMLFPHPEKINIVVLWLVAQSVSSFSGCLSYPFDTVRRRLMMQSGRLEADRCYTGTMDCWRRIYKDEGLPGFYKGAIANILRSMGGALVLVLYDRIKPIFFTFFQR